MLRIEPGEGKSESFEGVGDVSLTRSGRFICILIDKKSEPYFETASNPLPSRDVISTKLQATSNRVSITSPTMSEDQQAYISNILLDAAGWRIGGKGTKY